MTQYTATHDGLDRVVAGFSALSEALTRVTAGITQWASGAFSQAMRRHIALMQENRLMEIARWDHRVAQELRAIRSHHQSNR